MVILPGKLHWGREQGGAFRDAVNPASGRLGRGRPGCVRPRAEPPASVLGLFMLRGEMVIS